MQHNVLQHVAEGVTQDIIGSISPGDWNYFYGILTEALANPEDVNINFSVVYQQGKAFI